MRRIDLINASSKILTALDKSNLDAVFSSDPTIPKLRSEESLAIYSSLMRYYDAFSELEKKLLKLLNVEDIIKNSIWATIISSGDRSIIYDLAPNLPSAVYYTKEFLPKFIDLLKQDNISYSYTEAKASVISPIAEGREIITLILPEQETETSKPARLIEAIESITSFYHTIAEIDDFNPDDLSVVALDSGSDKSFDFLGAAKVVTAVKELIIELWDRIVFHKERKLIYQAEAITKALPVFEKINSLQQEGKIQPEKGELMRRSLEDGVSKFIKVGAIIPEFENRSNHNPRQIMLPERKLIAYPKGESDSRNSNLTKEKNDTQPKTEETKASPAFSTEQMDIIKKMFEEKKETIKSINKSATKRSRKTKND